MFPILPKQISIHRRYAVLEGYFSNFECDAAIAAAMQVPESQATVSVERLTNDYARKSKLRWIYWNGQTDWLFRKIHAAVDTLNTQIFGFDLTGIREIQYTEYHAPDGHYGWHQDLGERDMSTRKLSLTVQLSTPEEYDGGDFEIFNLNQVPPKTKGSVIAFPSYEYHKVNPVTVGLRRSLVVWVTGPVFR